MKISHAFMCIIPMLSLFIITQSSNGSVSIKQVRQALQNKKFTEAAEFAEESLKVSDKDRGTLTYYKALTLFHIEKYNESAKACQSVIEQHKDSTWYRKAFFLKAQCHIRLKEFKKAEDIYDSEVRRLLSKSRKEDIARIYFRFAEAVSRKPGNDELGTPPPDYQKAYELYRKVLELEINRDLKDETMFLMGRMMQMVGNHNQAISEYRSYLHEFDPSWLGPVNSTRRERQDSASVIPGKYIHQVRYYLAQSQIALDQVQWARVNLEDLIKMLETISTQLPLELTPEARFLMVKTYHFPEPRNDDELNRGIKAAQEFIDDYPNDPRSVKLGYDIGSAYSSMGKSHQALEAYKTFLETEFNQENMGEKWDNLGKSQYIKLDIIGFNPSSENLSNYIQKLRMLATYRRAEILFSQKNYPEAINVWNSYIAQFPNGPRWNDAQQGIVNAEYQKGLDLIAEEKYDEAVAVWDNFLKEHPLDGRSRQIMFIYGLIHYYKAKEQKDKGNSQNYRMAISEWEKLVNKYPNTEESSLALFRIGQIYEEKIGDLEKALEAYRRLTWGGWHDDAQNRIKSMTEKNLRLVTERVFRTNEPAKVKLNLRNIKKVTVSVYKVDLEAYWRKMNGITGVENLDIALISPDETWEYEVPEYEKYKPFEQEIEIPFDKAGVCAVHISEEDLEATTMVIRSDIDAIIKASRREILIFTQDMINNQPVPDAKVLVSDGKSIISEGKTGPDGVFYEKANELKNASNVTAFIIKDNSASSNVLQLQGLGLAQGLSPRGYIYTHKPVYRPGQKVYVKGIIRDVTDGSYSVSPEAPYKVSIIDPRGRLIYSEELKLSRFGTFDMEMLLDDSSSVGEYRITAQSTKEKDKIFNGVFSVEQYQLEKIRLALEFPRKVYFRGEKVEATFSASYYYGQPLKERTIRYVLPDGRSYTGKTDAEGKLKIEFDTTPMQPGTVLNFNGSIDGENVQVYDTVFLALLGFNINVKPSSNVVISGEPFEAMVTTTRADGEPTGKDLTLKVYRQTERKVHPIFSQIPWIGDDSKPGGEVEIEEHKITTDQKTGKGRIKLSLEQGGRYILRVKGVDRFDQPVSGEGSIQISDDSDSVKLRVFSDTSELKVGEKHIVRIHSRLKPTLALVTFEGEGIISHQVLSLKEGWNEMEFEAGNEHFPNFHLSVVAIDGQHLRTAGKDFNVLRRIMVTMTLNDTYKPGEEAEVTVKTLDQIGNPVEAEMAMVLVDEALYSIYDENVLPINDFFNEGIHRDAPMRTVSSCTFSYKPPTRKVSKEVLEELSRMEIAEKYARDKAGVLKELNGTISLGIPVESAELRDRQMLDEEVVAEDALSLNRKRYAGRSSKQLRAQETPAALMKSDMDFAYFADSPALAPSGGGGVAFGEELTAGYGLAPQIRREIAGLGYWNPSVITDKNGEGKAVITMPERTTQWRLTARGCTVETLVGQVFEKTVIRKDFFVDAKVPSIVTEGDKIRVHTRIHNLTDFAGKAQLNLKIEIDGAGTKGIQETVDVSGNDTVEFVFPEVEITSGREVQLELTAKAGEMSDGISRKIPIRPWGMEYSHSSSGVSSGNETVFLELTKGIEYISNRLNISIGPDVNRMVFDMAMNTIRPMDMSFSSRIHPVPGDVGSDLLALAYALDYLEAVGGDSEDSRQLVSQARSLSALLVTRQRDDGGWWWCENAEQSDIHVSARNLWALLHVQKQGIEVHSEAIEKGIAYMKEAFARLEQQKDYDKSVVLHTLSAGGEADFAYANRLYRNRNNLNPAALAYTALIFANLDRKEIGGEMLEVLASKSDKKASKGLYENVETAALAMLAWEMIQPESPVVDEILNFIMSQRTFYGYSPYKAKGPVVAALAMYYGKSQYSSSDYNLEIKVNGKSIKVIDAKDKQPAVMVKVPLDMVKDGQNKVEFQLKGSGNYAYTATLSGFSPEFKDPESWKNPHIRSRNYYHAPIEYKGRQIASSTTQITQLEAGAQTYVSVDIKDQWSDRYFVVHEYLPAGTTLVNDSVSGNFQHYEAGYGMITFYYPPGRHVRDYRYQLVSYAPGTYRAMPSVIMDSRRPGQMRLGEAKSLEVLAPGEKSKDEYQMNDSELYELGKAYFNDNKYADSLELLTKLYDRNKTYNQRESARMLLWICTEEEHYNAKNVIEYFEILRERFPELYIPFDKILVVGRSYREIGEFERAYLVYKATIEASFVNDSRVSAVLEDEGQFLSSIDFQEDLWREYPDLPQVVSAYFALSQALYAKAPEARELAKNQRQIPILKGQSKSDIKKITKLDLLKETALMLAEFLTLYSTDPLADDATFSMANVLLDLEDHQQVVKLCKGAQYLYPESDYLASFQYVEALGFFSQRKYDEAVEAAKVVADGKSDDRDLARYILGQIYHSRGKPEMAIDWYEKVKTIYPDAGESINYFRKKQVSVDEVKVFQPTEEASVKIKYRNIQETSLQVYKVDLMKLYLREKDLSKIRSIQLAGIEPEFSKTIKLGDGKDYVDKEHIVPLEIKDEGAYLVICRGDELFTSGLVLLTPLKMEVQEDAVSGRIRVNVRDVVDDLYKEDIHVKVVGSEDQIFKSGETDLRGIFTADDIRGKATVIARSGKDQYAFYRGEQWLGKQVTHEGVVQQERMPERQQQADYRSNIGIMNQAIQGKNFRGFDEMRRGGKKGVQVQYTQ
ncbi:tetratricopeptide repeat protein [Candidatus Poribacteria bacterium]|nr:tetratricopeptide repeat protein [Candidatus Poribacteria bacterium]